MVSPTKLEISLWSVLFRWILMSTLLWCLSKQNWRSHFEVFAGVDAFPSKTGDLFVKCFVGLTVGVNLDLMPFLAEQILLWSVLWGWMWVSTLLQCFSQQNWRSLCEVLYGVECGCRPCLDAIPSRTGDLTLKCLPWLNVGVDLAPMLSPAELEISLLSVLRS